MFRIALLTLGTLHSLWCLHDCANACAQCATKLRITQRRIFLEGTVVVGVGPWRTALLNFCSTKQVNLSNEHWFLWICTLCCSVLSFDSNITCLSHLSIAPLSWGLWKKIQLLVFFIFCSHFESINQRSP